MEVLPSKRPRQDDTEPQENPLNLKGTQFLPTPAPTSETASTNTLTDKTSPTAPPSESELSSIEDVSSIAPQDAHQSSALKTPSDATRPAKRRKLTPAEKLEQQQQKETKALEREAKKQEIQARKQEQAELKAKRDEEKHERDVEKRKKAEEREAKRREKEMDDERKVQEKLKKERAQMRLGAFFQAPPAGTTLTTVPTRRRSLSLETYDASNIADAVGAKEDHPPSPALQPKSDYRSYFLPFELKPHTTIYQNVHSPDSQLETSQLRFDNEIQNQPQAKSFDLGIQSTYPDLRACFPRASRRKCRLISVPTIHRATRNDAEITTGGVDTAAELSAIPVRYIQFHEDVRPPYFGTFTSIQSEKTANQMRCDPFCRGRLDTNYDYDSEAEWEESDPEGEDLENDEEDDESVDDGNEMDEFLDDENDELANRRRVTVSDLVPQSTGICWQAQDGKQYQSTMADTDQALLSSLKLQFLLPSFHQTSIDPFSMAYWPTTKSKEPESETSKPQPDEVVARPPLAERSSNTPSRGLDSAWPIQDKDQQNVPVAKPRLKAGTQKTMTAAEFDAFKDEVVGSLLGKQELITKLKTSFPKLTAVLVKDTLSEKFAQVGKTKADKKWVQIVET